ncbi:metal-dependent hydrolase [Candidatus Woesearchaeota archaeon]|jgi:membrane-bound metal-dependent hydrolase YbcI (DUF457 family)|nr:metal-dependent hydrolase [Candidatus Woesearchaeota archaeon]MBT5397169.1 metal-dependent hydrolase [Candidatus Woesearchaeota archaeon]MBT5924847.1 metal-dependent hydrolase [Candidatus Woesearchaeota archaeon]MBT6367285.1 metal-dependent hydrolase [Candidatus Woesearchaeota archaeon]MBT7762569.1 metal-dependent hydrolase [Candidatus Woesearchaeota archaeon]
MPFAFGHLIGAWIAGKAYERITKKKIKHYTWFFLLFGSILPDIDFLIDWTLGTEVHRTFSHSLLFIVGISFLVYIVFRYLKNKDAQQFAIALGAGIFIHIALDMISTLGVPLFWPNLAHISYTSIQYINPADVSMFIGEKDILIKEIKSAVFDMGLGTVWIFYLWFKKKITF